MILSAEPQLFVSDVRAACAWFEELGFEPIVSHSAREALEELAGGERPQVMFSDVVMPGGISGIELAHKVRTRFPELPILLTTGYSEDVGGTHGFTILQKPYELDSLTRALAGVLRRELTAG